MSLKAHGQPDGTFDVDGERYRLQQDDDHFVVVRTSDGTRIGGFELKALTRPRKAAVLDQDTAERDIVKAIAELVSQPRGLLPLQ